MRPYDSIILTQDLSDTIRAGTVGAIVDTYRNVDDVYIVELFDRDGATIDVVDVRADQMAVTLADFFAGDQIALLVDIPAYKLRRGQVGLIQERAGVGLYQVEFADAEGKPFVRLTLHAGQMLLLRWQPGQARQSA
ncbi:MAG: DUF4926 domain-containing protein [Chloroflexi bacterium]|nr:DUF4926 domain-containing protein [Chloroflexota bacterium]